MEQHVQHVKQDGMVQIVMPLILNNAQITKFTNTIMSNASITSSKLLFKASRDGFSASSFHSKCDNKGPTIVIVKSTSGAIFGGYTSALWSSSQTGNLPDSNAFLFSLVSSTKEERFTKLTYENSYYYKKNPTSTTNPNGIYNNFFSYGPVFGGGSDIRIADNSNLNTNSLSSLCYSYCNSTMEFNTDAAKTYLAGTFNFQVEDYETYSL